MRDDLNGKRKLKDGMESGWLNCVLRKIKENKMQHDRL